MKRRLVIVFVCALPLSACGIKGPLELPPRPDAAPPAQAPADLNKAPSPKPQ